MKTNSVCLVFAYITVILASCTKSHNDHQYVDLGLSVNWATCNIGATKPEEYGDYFAWGATEPLYEEGYAQENPQQHWKKGKSLGYTCVNAPYQTEETDRYVDTRWSKYLGDISSEYTDNSATNEDAKKIMLDLEDDAAYVNWGGDWRMPTKEEIDELMKNCIWIKTKLNGIDGYKAMSKVSGYENKWIFFPFTGYRSDTELYYFGEDGDYWSKSICLKAPASAEFLQLDTKGKKFVLRNRHTRYTGHPIRPVCP